MNLLIILLDEEEKTNRLNAIAMTQQPHTTTHVIDRTSVAIFFPFASRCEIVTAPSLC
jgi:hypothetical protein